MRSDERVGKEPVRGGRGLRPTLPVSYRPLPTGGEGWRGALTSNHAVCLWIPLFALRSELRRRPTLDQQPAALLSPDDTRRVWQVSRTARRIGVRPNMTVSQAVGMCPEIRLCEPDPIHYDEEFANLLKALGNVSPVIEPAELGRVFIGVDGLEKLYGGAEEQVEAIVNAVEPFPRFTAAYRPLPPGGERWGGGSRPGWEGMGVRVGYGLGKFTAWVAATKATPGNPTIVPDSTRTEFLVRQSVSVLPVDPDTHARLRRLGITTLGRLARLPEVAVVSQFGAKGRKLWRLARGTAVDPVTGREVPEPIKTHTDFPTPTTDRATLGHALDRLVEKGLRHPRCKGWRVLQVHLRARQEHGTSWATRVTLKNPSIVRDDISAPLKTRMDQMQLSGAVVTLAIEFCEFARGMDELQLFARDAASSARAGRKRALQRAVHEINSRFRKSLYHVIPVHPESRLPERRYALIDYEP